MFRFLFPSYEKPIAPPRYVNIEPENRDFRGVGTVLLLAAACGVAFALWEPSHQVTTPFVTTSVSRSVPVATEKTAGTETTATATAAEADAEDDQVTPTVKLSTLCSQRATARRDCAGAKAFRDARLNAPDPVPAPAKEAKRAAPAAKTASAVQPAAAPAAAQPVAAATPEATGDAQQPEASTAQVQKTAAAPKAKRPRPAEEAPVERLVRVYDQVMPDGRRVPVYRRVGSGGLETGTIVDGEYRPSRNANLEPPRGRYFGLQ